MLEGKVLVSGASVKWEGQLTVYNYKDGPCYRCLYPICPKSDSMQSCSDNGVIGMAPGIIGQLEAMECVKIIVGADGVLKSRLVLMDGIAGNFKTVRIRGKMNNCVMCNKENRKIEFVKDYDYEEFSGMTSKVFFYKS